MTLEQQLNQAKDAAAVAAKRAETAEAGLAAKDQTIAALEKDKADLAAKVEGLGKDGAKLAGELEAANQTISDLNGKVASTEKDVDRRAGLKSAAQLAKVGVKPVSESTEAGANGTDLWAQYHALPDAKTKREFYLAHKDQM